MSLLSSGKGQASNTLSDKQVETDDQTDFWLVKDTAWTTRTTEEDQYL